MTRTVTVFHCPLHKQPVANWIIVSRRRLLPDAYRSFSWKIANRRILNGCFNQQQSFKLLKKTFCEGLDPANTCHSENVQIEANLQSAASTVLLGLSRSLMP